MNIIVAGGRDFYNKNLVFSKLDLYITSSDTIISGHATGVDSLGELYAAKHNLDLKVIPAEWKKYGNAAGPIRNQKMANLADKLIVFWDKKSRGTKSMITIAKKMNIPIIAFDYHGNLLNI